MGVVITGALLIWGLLGFYQLDEQERAVVLRFGRYHATQQPGLQWNPPLVDEVIQDPEWNSEIGRFARIHDPEGNPVELWEPAGPAAG